MPKNLQSFNMNTVVFKYQSNAIRNGKKGEPCRISAGVQIRTVGVSPISVCEVSPFTLIIIVIHILIVITILFLVIIARLNHQHQCDQPYCLDG